MSNKSIQRFNSLKFSRINEPNNIIKAIGDGLFIFVSGVLLLTPGFATDILGFILFLKFFRNIILRLILKKVNFSKFSRVNDRNL